MQKSHTMPIYQKIALDIANNIYSGNITEGSTLHGRSALAAKYNVSPETIRRSVKLLAMYFSPVPENRDPTRFGRFQSSRPSG